MPSKVYLPTLSEDSWTNSSLRVSDYLFSHFFLSDYSQTHLYDGHVASLAYILHVTQKNINDTVSMVTDTLTNYYSRYFNDVVVEVTVIDPNSTEITKTITIHIDYKDESGEIFTVNKSIEYADSKIKKVIDINNFGALQ